MNRHRLIDIAMACAAICAGLVILATTWAFSDLRTRGTADALFKDASGALQLERRP